MPRRDTLDALVAELGRIPVELRRQLRPALRRAAEPILRDAQRRAAWSTRIPGAITVRTSFSQRTPGLRLRVDAGKAPHARPFEMGSQRAAGGSLRHPVFGNRNVWVAQRTRPFFFPAVNAGRPAVMAETNAAVLAAARAAGFR